MTVRILVVDDEEHIRSVLQDYLEDQGFDVLLAADLASARRLIHDAPLPDIVLVDLGLPDGSGLHLLQDMKASPRTKHIPIIVTSAHVGSKSGGEGAPDGYLEKPFDLKNVKGRLESYLRKN